MISDLVVELKDFDAEEIKRIKRTFRKGKNKIAAKLTMTKLTLMSVKFVNY